MASPSEASIAHDDHEMTTYAFIHGAGDVGWYWHLVEAELRRRGHDTVAPDLPIEDDRAGLSDHADVVVAAVGDRRDVVVVAQSFGGYVAPIVAARIDARLIVLVAGMVPKPGESAEEMFAATRWAPEEATDGSARAVFYHDVPADLAEEALARGGRRQSETPGREPWPMPRWPEIPTRFVLCRNDRFFRAAWLRTVVRDRLAIVPDELESGHCPALSRPRELADLLERYASEEAAAGDHGEPFARAGAQGKGRAPTESKTIELSIDELRGIAGYAAECARWALPVFERDEPDDSRPRDAIEAALVFARGGKRTSALRTSALAAYRAGQEAIGPAAVQAARAAGAAAAAAYLHPLASADQVKHILGSAAHAARAAELDAGDDRSVGTERRDRAVREASPVVAEVLARYPAAPSGGGRTGELLRDIDAALRRADRRAEPRR